MDKHFNFLIVSEETIIHQYRRGNSIPVRVKGLAGEQLWGQAREEVGGQGREGKQAREGVGEQGREGRQAREGAGGQEREGAER